MTPTNVLKFPDSRYLSLCQHNVTLL